MTKIMQLGNYTKNVKKPSTVGLIPYSIRFEEEVTDPIFLEFKNIPAGLEIYLPTGDMYSGPFQITDGYPLTFKYIFNDTIDYGTYQLDLVNITNDELVSSYTFVVEE